MKNYRQSSLSDADCQVLVKLCENSEARQAIVNYGKECIYIAFDRVGKIFTIVGNGMLIGAATIVAAYGVRAIVTK